MGSILRLFQSLVVVAISFLFTCDIQAQSNAKQVIHMQNGTYEVDKLNANELAVDANDDEAVGGYVFRILAFETVPNKLQRIELEKRGIYLLEYLPERAWIAAIKSSTTIIAATEFKLNNIVPLLPRQKLAKTLAYGDVPEYAVRPDSRVELQVQFHRVLNSEVVIAALFQQGWQPESVDDYGHVVTLTADINDIMKLASLPYLAHIEPIDPPAEPENYTGRTLHRVNLLTSDAMGRSYNGDGVWVALGDDGLVGPHVDYTGRIDQTNVSGNSGDHGDHCAGIIFGAGNKDPKTQGMAWGADLQVWNVWNAINNSNTSYVSPGVRITSTSYGNGCNAGYTTFARDADRLVYNNKGLVHVFSGGNSGTTDCGYGAGNVWGNITGGVKVGKNVLCVGRVDQVDVIAGSSSRGPAEDGRLKPDICSKGSSVYSTVDVDSYSTKSGTSMSCPGVAGTFAMLIQGYRETHGGNDPYSGLIKGIILNTGEDLGNPGPDFIYGWGRINAHRAIKVIEDNRFVEDSIDTGELNSHNVVVPAGLKEVRFMVYWTDFEGTPGAAKALVNDLNIVMHDPNPVSYSPWVLDPTPIVANLNANAVRGTDSLNNMEQVTLTNPIAGTYTIDVDGFNVPVGPQRYWLTWEFIQDTLELTYPVGGEPMVPGETEHIRWDTYGNSGNFTLEYSTNGGLTWSNISTTVPGSRRYYAWVVPSVVTGRAMVRISRSGLSDESREHFSIIAVPQNLNIEWACQDSVELSWDPVTGATGYEVSMLGTKYMDSLGYTTATTDAFFIGNPLPERWFSVKALSNNDCVGRRAIAIKKNTGTVSCPINDELELTQVLSPTTGVLTDCQSITGLTVSIELRNNGTTAVSAVPVGFQVDAGPITNEVFAGPLNVGNTTTYVFTGTADFSGVSIHELKVWHSMTTDDNNWNDSGSVTITVVSGSMLTPPFLEDFESFALCGTASNCAAGTCALSNGWINKTNGSDDDIDWRTDENGTPSTGTGPAVDYDPGSTSGNYVYLEGSGCYGMEAYLESPCIDLTTTVSPELNFAYHMEGDDMGSLHLDVFSNNTWDLDVTPAISGDQGGSWLTRTVSLSAYVGEIISVRFRGITGPAYQSDIALDAIGLVDLSLAAISAFAADTTTGCVNDTIGFMDQSGNTPTNWNWTVTPGTHAFVSGTNNSSQDPQILFNAGGLYTVMLSTNNAFGGDSLTKTDYIQIIDVANPIGISDTICSGGSPSLTGTPVAPGSSLAWFSNPTGGSALATGTPYLPGPTTSLLNVYLEASAGGCSSGRVQVNAVVNAVPILSSLGPDVNLCTGDTSSLHATAGYYAYLWSDGITTSSSIVISSAGTYFVDVTDLEGCSSRTDSVIVQMYPLPVVSLGPDYQVCEGEVILLDAGPGMLSYDWNNGLGNAQTFAAATAGIYYVDVIDGNGCKNRADSVTMGILPNPNPSLGPDFTLYYTQTFTLNPGSGFTLYNWNTGETTPTIDIVADVLGHGLHTFIVEVEDDYGCVGVDTIMVRVERDLGIEGEDSPSIIRVYPNPTNGKVYILVGELLSGEVSAVLSNSVGQVVLSAVGNPDGAGLLQLDAGHLAVGTYMLRLEYGDKTFVKVLLKE